METQCNITNQSSSPAKNAGWTAQRTAPPLISNVINKKNMDIPEAYIRERKLQKLVYIVFPLAGVVGALILNEEWLRILIATAFCTFSFTFLHTAYLGIKYSLVHLTTGVYSKEENPLKYFLINLGFILGGLYFLYTAYYV